MLRLRDIMTSEVMTLTPQSTLREAMELFARHHVSGAPVLAGGSLVGVVSSTDLMMFAASLSGVPTQRESDEWSEGPEPSLEEDVTRGNEPPSAFFSEMWEDAGAEVSGRMTSDSSPEWNVLEEHTVSEMMTSAPLVTLPPDAGAELAAKLMREQGIHRILVTDGARLVGIVSSLDLVRAVADRQFTVRQYVFNRA